jgi:hypothetical protein
MGSQSVSVAVGVVFDDQGSVMLARTAYGARQIGPPGGRIELVGGELRIPRDEISEVIWSDPRSLPEPADLVGPFAIADALDHNWGVVREGLVWRPR